MSTNIEHLFVPYEESLELKELGFDDSCLYHWHKSCKTHPFTNEVFNPNCRPRTNSGIKDIGDENHVWSAPIFSQAFKWFRDEHNLRYKFEPSRENTVDIFIWTDIGWEYFKNANEEKAELVCLRKLIQISKS